MEEFQLEIGNMDIRDDQDTSDDLQSNGDIRRYPDTFCQYQSKKMIEGNMSWDHALLFTGLDLYTTLDYDTGSFGRAYPRYVQHTS